VSEQATEQVTSVYAIRDATVKLGLFTREPLFLVGYDSGRFAVVYLQDVDGDGTRVSVELADTHWPNDLP
jgi:hypothetical protein